jgi:hypothetical protein
MTLVVTCNCHRHLRISFFLMLWMFSYVQMVDQLRLDLSDLKSHVKHLHHTNNTPGY